MHFLKYSCIYLAALVLSCGTWVCSLCLASSIDAMHGLYFSAACGIFLDQKWNPQPVQGKADSKLQPTSEIPHVQFYKMYTPAN